MTAAETIGLRDRGAAKDVDEFAQKRCVRSQTGAHGVRIIGSGWLIKLFRIHVRKSQQKQLDKIKASTKNWYRLRLVVKINAKWFREFMAYNPAEEMPKIQAPVLALTGSKDIQVDPADLDVMAGLIQAPFESHVLPDITHLLRSEPGAPTFFNYKKQIKQPVAPIVLDTISDWLRKKVPLPGG